MPGGPRPVVAIIGGGYTGAAVAHHLARHLGSPDVASIVVIEPRATLGAGLAYGTDDPSCRINVPANRMSLEPEHPGDFQTWLDETGEAAADPEAALPDGRRFPRRAAFGRYVAARLAPSLAKSLITHRRAMVVRVEAAGTGYRLTLGDRSTLEADLVVIATSHPPPAVPRLFAEMLQGNPRLIRDATRPGALAGIAADERVLIIGTGLTMADVVASLDAQGHLAPITAFSRRGQLPAAHPAAAVVPFGDFVSDPARSARTLVRRIRTTIARARACGVPAQAVFDALRAQGQPIWQALPLPERRRLVRHLRVYWDARRFRVAPQVEAILEQRRGRELFATCAGRVFSVTVTASELRVSIVMRGRGKRLEIAADRIVIATGPAHSALLEGAPFLAALSASGFIAADKVGLGLATDTCGRAIGRDGTMRDTLLIAGPLSRGAFGELMGLPEVTGNAVMIAGNVARWIEQWRRPAEASRRSA